MYTGHFHLRSEAFSLTPDPAFLYLSPGHAEALAGLKVGLEGRRGLMVVVGEVGMGKTTVLYSLLTELGEGIKTAYISNTKLPFDDILRQALSDFGVPCASRDRVELLSALNGFLRECASDGTTAALVIDEAQNLESDVFENLRLLSNYETYTEKLLQIVLVGQPELEMKLRHPSLRQVVERVAVRCNINPLSRAESMRYVEHRLQRAGGSASAIFTTPALEFLLVKARGIPRRINILCHTAMLFAYGRGEQLVTFSMARAAAREKEGRGLITLRRGLLPSAAPAAEAQTTPRFRPAWAGVGFVAGIVVMVGLGVLDGRTAPRDAVSAPAAQPLLDESAEALQRERADKRLNEAIETLTAAIAAQQKANAEAPAVVTPNAEELPAPTLEPQSYKEIRVRRGTTLRALVKEVYGQDKPDLIDRIKTANPQIVNADRIIAGDMLRFPDSATVRE
ncbi:MAG TPA: AAA family ATPase [Candidatus Binatia bacterium]|jgi:general secretion pathway protein A